METTQQTARFFASGSVRFTTSMSIDTAELLRALTDADEASPWVCRYERGEQTPSITQYGEFHMSRLGSNYAYSITIRPQCRLKIGQLVAYQRYVENVSRQLAAADIANVVSVEAAVEFRGSYVTFAH